MADFRSTEIHPGDERSPRVVVGAGVPIGDANVVFAELGISEEEIAALGFDTALFRQDFEQPGLYRVLQFEDGRVLVLVATGGLKRNDDTNDTAGSSTLADVLLRSSLRGALQADAAAEPSSKNGAHMWLPLLGFPEHLHPLNAASIMAGTLFTNEPVSELWNIREITISTPETFESSDLLMVESVVRQALDYALTAAVVADNVSAQANTKQVDTSSSSTASAPTPTPPLADETHFRSDRPVTKAEDDLLNRNAVAQAIHAKVREIWQSSLRKNETPAPFMMHIAGRWGSGKSSVLNLLRRLLEKDTSLSPVRGPGYIGKPPARGWVVVEFNAWRAQGHGPAWWSLINALATEAEPQLEDPVRYKFAASEQVFRFWRLWGTYVWTGLLVVTVVLGILAFNSWDGTEANDTTRTREVTTTQSVETDNGTQVTVEKAQTTLEKPTAPDPGFGKILLTVVPILTAFLTVLSFVTTLNRRSQQTAEQLETLDDPTAPLKARFDQMMGQIERPVAIFIDDLDRCDATYVVELLQAIQTIYSGSPVLYVVAADRDWIVSAYNQAYKDFRAEIDRPAQPLGYLFVKKIFQLSVNIPDLDEEAGREYLSAQLPGAEREEDLTEDQADDIRQRVRQMPTIAARQSYVASLESMPKAQRVAGAASLVADFAPESQKEIEHLLIQRLAVENKLLDPNPRSIKRLVNAFSFRRGFALAAGRVGAIEKLPFWCALDLRFPYAAKRLAEAPSLTGGAWSHKEYNAHFPKQDHDEIGDILKHLTEADVKELRGFG